ncbi:hypothetical protein BLNAU_25102 [Blattamonas nauphoetae]|uniref:Uncharacterized protein n=1 Tax=Blattamonas nauphoetae TaxID=2049346 RepID=A0ABQ9WKY9_9EUKA|nr:hypothetical protein BLNAU_25102 [Blattamonas nauphoetae]
MSPSSLRLLHLPCLSSIRMDSSSFVRKGHVSRLVFWRKRHFLVTKTKFRLLALVGFAEVKREAVVEISEVDFTVPTGVLVNDFLKVTSATHFRHHFIVVADVGICERDQNGRDINTICTGSGGAFLSTNGDSNQIVSITSCLFHTVKSEKDGGVILARLGTGSTLTVVGTTFTSCSSTGSGGVLFVSCPVDHNPANLIIDSTFGSGISCGQGKKGEWIFLRGHSFESYLKDSTWAGSIDSLIAPTDDALLWGEDGSEEASSGIQAGDDRSGGWRERWGWMWTNASGVPVVVNRCLSSFWNIAIRDRDRNLFVVHSDLESLLRGVSLDGIKPTLPETGLVSKEEKEKCIVRCSACSQRRRISLTVWPEPPSMFTHSVLTVKIEHRQYNNHRLFFRSERRNHNRELTLQSHLCVDKRDSLSWSGWPVCAVVWLADSLRTVVRSVVVVGVVGTCVDQCWFCLVISDCG